MSSLSKIIKSCCVIQEKNARVLTTHNSSMEFPLTLDYSQQNHDFTGDVLSRDHADTIFLETKHMMEALMFEAQQKADELIREATLKAETITNKTMETCDAIKDSAYQEGYQAGYQKALKVEAQLKQVYDQAMEFTQDIREQKGKLLLDKEKEILELIFTLTERILGTILETKPEIIHHIIKRTLEEVKDAEKITLKVNPIHIPYMSAYNEEFSELYSGKILVVEDPNLKPGDCIVQTENGFLDSRLGEQLEVLKKGLLKVAGYNGI